GALALAPAALAAQPVPCGGDFGAFVNDLAARAVDRGHDRATVDAFFRSVNRDPSVIAADRRQGIFQRPFIEFSRQLISQNRLDQGRRNAQRHDAIFDAIERRYGVQRGILLAFWAFETDYGGFQGDYNTANALVTLAHDCRRPELFRPQVFSAIALFAQGGFDPATTTGAWAGEIGMVQMLPGDILEHGVDGDGDGRVTLKTSVADALMSGANLLRSFGWRPNEPWLHEVTVPDGFDYSQSGLRTEMSVAEWQRMGVRPRHGQLPSGSMAASVIVPQGRGGPAFMVFPNFRTLFEWNESFTYVVTTAYFATRLEGAPVYDAGNPEPGLNQAQMMELQRRLSQMGYDVGGIDGILGAGTRAAVQDVEEQLGLPADAWPTPALLDRL
ncbi:lytic murein transglycosylase, partial [Rhodobacteraceae bacterium WD3A24]